MKKLPLLLASVCLLTLTGCLNIIEEMYLNKDGSGKYTLTFDMSQLFEDSFLKEMFQQSLKEGEGPQAGIDMEQDTVVYFKDVAREMGPGLERPEFWEKVVMRMTISESRKKLLTVLELNFDKVDDIGYLYENLDKLDADKQLGGGMVGSGTLIGSGISFRLSGRELTRNTLKPQTPAEDDENLAMMKMLAAEATYKAIYHLPGKVRKTTLPNARIDDKTVTLDMMFTDLLEGKIRADGNIVFNKK